MDKYITGRYIQSQSFIHKLDPRSKIKNTMFIIFIIIINPIYFVGNIIMFFLLLFIQKLSDIPISHVIKMIKRMLPVIVFLIITNLFLIKNGKILYSHTYFTIYDKPFIQSFIIIIKVINITLTTTILTATTKPFDLIKGLQYTLFPLTFFKCNTHEISFIIITSIQFIPILLIEIERITKAQISRGADFKSNNVKQKVQTIVSIIIPLFHSTIKRADQIADAMEIRSYSLEKKRTSIYEFCWSYKDTLTTFIVFFLFIISMKINFF